jgi:glutamate dehydrogenase/leucine dehydrogenase
LIGVAEVGGSIYNPNGLDYQAVKDYLTEHKTLKGFPDVEFYESEEAIYKPWYFKAYSATSSSLRLWR